jgi:Rps23 Pro-64 3,4-dihydroxylase Tpa1-like proline 4-hydroxylase
MRMAMAMALCRGRMPSFRMIDATSRTLSSTSSAASSVSLDTAALQSKLTELAPSIAASLLDEGYYTTTSLFNFDDKNKNSTGNSMEMLRHQAIALYQEGRYEQSWSESIDAATGRVTRFDKPGVWACEPDGADYETAPDMISYMSTLISTLPRALNESLPETVACISDQSFNAKLALTMSKSEYPLHVDNSLGVSGGDMRKLTCILYLNPNYNENRDGGQLRLHLSEDKVVDLDPGGTRFVCFWTDEIPHKVLLTGSTASGDDNNSDDSDDDDDTKKDATAMDRYALTVWLADEYETNIHNPASKFAPLRHSVRF